MEIRIGKGVMVGPTQISAELSEPNKIETHISEDKSFVVLNILPLGILIRAEWCEWERYYPNETPYNVAMEMLLGYVTFGANILANVIENITSHVASKVIEHVGPQILQQGVELGQAAGREAGQKELLLTLSLEDFVQRKSEAEQEESRSLAEKLFDSMRERTTTVQG